jgi:hypothetical protein
MFRDAGILGSFGLLGCSVAALTGGLALLAVSKGGIQLAAWPLIGFGLLLAAVSAAAFVVLLAELARKRSRSLQILESWHCYYWPQEQRVRVSIPLDIHSEADTCRITCTAQFGQFKVPLSLVSGDLGRSLFRAGRYVPELTAGDVELPDGVTVAAVDFKIQLSDGVSKKSSRPVPIQVVSG